jgi:hypothetical protein
MSYGVVVYNARVPNDGSGPQIHTQVRIFRDGNPVFVGKEQALNLNNPSDLKRLGAAGSIKLGSDMVPGEYVFQVVVTDSLANSKHRVATQAMDFEMVP